LRREGKEEGDAAPTICKGFRRCMVRPHREKQNKIDNETNDQKKVPASGRRGALSGTNEQA